MPSLPKPPLVLLVAAVLALGGCGRRGDLEPPPNVNAVQTPQANNNLTVQRTVPKITPPKKDFVLDPLLQ